MSTVPTSIIPPIPVLGVQITLVTANTVYNLLSLIQAVEAFAAGTVTAFEIQIDPSSPAANVFIGDAKMKTTATKRYGYIIPTGNSGAGFWFTPSGDAAHMPIGSFYIAADQNNVIINILAVTTW